MMLHKKSQKSHLLKLLALLPIVAVALALNAQTVQDVVYTSAGKDSIEVVVVESAVQDAVVPTKVGEEEVAEAETIKVSGQVVSVGDGKPIIGAVVQVAGSKRGTVTDTEGKFTIEAPVGAKVNVLYVGYRTEVFTVRSDEGKYNTLIPLQKEGEARVFDVVEEMPEYPGGMSAMMQYLSANVKYPEEAHKKGIQGRVIVTFVVEKDGSISDARIVRSVDPLLDAEALRVTNSMPKWKPGRQNGEAVAVKYTIPVTFKLNSSEKKDESYILKIDGKVVDDSLISSIPAGDVESMSIEKGENGKPKTIHIKTKHKK
jgi:TonB family protein